MLARRRIQQKGDVNQRMRQSPAPVIHGEGRHAALSLSKKRRRRHRQDECEKNEPRCHHDEMPFELHGEFSNIVAVRGHLHPGTDAE
jgi:hypothetical protein